jgi:DNA-binding transcriptional ArsR family regulator
MSPARARPRSTTPSPATLFAALGDDTRLWLLASLAGGDAVSISTLSGASPLTRQAITKHLRVLARSGLVRGERAGREHRWRLQPARLLEARAHLDLIGRQWESALGRLKASVER